MEEIMNKLHNVSETMLIPIRARYKESLLKNGIIKDKWAIQLVEQNPELTQYRKEVSIQTQKGIAIRTEILDELTQQFIQQHPDGIIINLGSGLDTRYFRLQVANEWYEVDLPEGIELRRNFYKETENYHYISKSVLDDSWVDDIPDAKKTRPTLFIAEGLLMYFEEKEIQHLLHHIKENFPQAEMIFEAMSPVVAKNSNRHPDIKHYDATFKWGIKSGKELEQWNIPVSFIQEYNYNRHLNKMPIKIALMYLIIGRLMKIVHIRFYK